MPWFKIDDGFWSNPKVLLCSSAAIGVWARAGSYCAGHLTDGFVSKATLKLIGSRRRDENELVESGLWSRVDDGFVFQNWAEFQPTKADVLAKRKVRADAGRAGGTRSGAVRRGEVVEPNAKQFASPVLQLVTSNGGSLTDEPPSRPVPTRPEESAAPSSKSPSRRKPAKPLSADWAPNDAHRTKALAVGVDVDHEAEQMRHWAHGKDERKADWDAAFLGWLGRTAQRPQQRVANAGHAGGRAWQE